MHKSDVGVVLLNVENKEQVRSAFDNLITQVSNIKPEAQVDGVLVQKMVLPGIETIIGMKRDLQLSPVVMCGMGGVWAEVMDDVSLRVAPLTKYDAEYI